MINKINIKSIECYSAHITAHVRPLVAIYSLLFYHHTSHFARNLEAKHHQRIAQARAAILVHAYCTMHASLGRLICGMRVIAVH